MQRGRQFPHVNNRVVEFQSRFSIGLGFTGHWVPPPWRVYQGNHASWDLVGNYIEVNCVRLSVPPVFSVFSYGVVGSRPGSPKFSADVKVVSVFATVRDKKGQIVHNLTKDDFALEEDTRPQTIRYLAPESDLPLTLGLLVDTSGSQRNVLGQERDASYKFFDQVLRPDKDKAFVIHFDHDVELLKDLTSSKKELDSALAELETPQLERRDQSGGGGGNSGGGGYPGGGGGGRGGGGGGCRGGGRCCTMRFCWAPTKS